VLYFILSTPHTEKYDFPVKGTYKAMYFSHAAYYQLFLPEKINKIVFKKPCQTKRVSFVSLSKLRSEELSNNVQQQGVKALDEGDCLFGFTLLSFWTWWKEQSFFYSPPRPDPQALGPNQPPVQWVLWVKQPERETSI
jgi:hypothetical protein